MSAEDEESDVMDHEDVEAPQEEKVILATREDAAVGWLRWLVALLLALVALAVCLSVYIVSKNHERQDFQDDFRDTRDKVVETFGSTLKQRFEILDNFAVDMASRVRNDPDTYGWPFATFPDFEIRAGKTARLGTFLDITVLPIVQTTQFEQWNNYSISNTRWITESLAFQQGIPEEEVVFPPVGPMTTFNITNEEFELVNAAERSGPYFPTWQIAPAIPFPHNVDIGGSFGSQFTAVMNSGVPVFSKALDAYDEPTSRRRQIVASLVEAFGGEFQNDAFSPIFYPVFDDIPGTTSNGNKFTVVALLRTAIYWRIYFEGMLPASSKGIVVVLESENCGSLYTYQIDGSEAICLGRGDLHDTKYDYLEAAVTTEKVLGLLSTNGTARGQCSYGVRVYPSQKLEDEYMTNNPLTFALVLAAVFVLTCATFLVYDYCVQRRQAIVMKSAQQSGKLVLSLFPADVRDRVYEEQEAKEKKLVTTNDWKSSRQEQGEGNLSFGDTKPSAIAKLYPDCSVLFADISGFTNWSSSRSPSDVFEFLEKVYGCFDALANRLRVFKIETIGDCYVACTGLPNAQPDHAVIMVRFANQCIRKFRELIHSHFVGHFGEETQSLALRLGIHSGPVTAGVLRGEKARFQIFGDTVNTASRMESNGMADKIQASQATADLIVIAGKESWLMKRQELVAAKGKGEMQTYWVNTNHSGKSICASSDGSSWC